MGKLEAIRTLIEERFPDEELLRRFEKELFGNGAEATIETSKAGSITINQQDRLVLLSKAIYEERFGIDFGSVRIRVAVVRSMEVEDLLDAAICFCVVCFDGCMNVTRLSVSRFLYEDEG